MTPDEILQAAQVEVLGSYKRDFEQLVAAFRDLDGKAQGTGTTAGAFLAAALAFLNRDGVLVSILTRGVALVAILTLMVTIVLAILCLRIRVISAAPSGEEVGALLRRLATEDKDEFGRRLLYFIGDVAALWRRSVAERREVNQRKAKLVRAAQIGLMSSALLVTVLMVVFLLAPRNTSRQSSLASSERCRAIRSQLELFASCNASAAEF